MRGAINGKIWVRMMRLHHWSVECQSFPIGHRSFKMNTHTQSLIYVLIVVSSWGGAEHRSLVQVWYVGKKQMHKGIFLFQTLSKIDKLLAGGRGGILPTGLFGILFSLWKYEHPHFTITLYKQLPRRQWVPVGSKTEKKQLLCYEIKNPKEIER